jgi:vitamin B12 transporter
MNNNTSAPACQVLIQMGSLLLAASLYAQAESLDETTVLATAYPTEKKSIGLRVNVEDATNLRDAGIWSLNDAALTSPGVNIFSSGANGTAASLFTRGTESDHTALFVDGVKLTDSRVFPFPASNILSGASIQPGERIELLRGPQSALYGSDAIGGVLSLSLEKGSALGTNRSWLEVGSFDSIHAGISFQGQEGKLSYNAFNSYHQTANDRERNDHESFHSGLRLDYALSGATNIGMTLRVLNFETEIPSLGTRPFAINETENTIYSIFLEHQLSDTWFSKLSIGGYESQFTNIGGFKDEIVETNYQSLQWRNLITWNDQHETSAGINVTWLDTANSEAGINDFSEQNESIYLQHRWHQDDLSDFLVGFRHDHYDEGQNSTTFRIAGSYEPRSGTRLHASTSSGFRRPSVVDLYGFGGFGGNLNLKSEESLGWDAGVTFEMTETSTLDITYFHNKIENLISYGPAPDYTAINIDEARTRGIEVSYRASFHDERIQTRLAYTWLEAENLSTGTRLIRRPTHTLNADINAKVSDKLVIGAGMTWVADREDYDFFAVVDAEDYSTARIYAHYQLSDTVSINGRIENLFDHQYSEIPNFPARGMGAFAGITIEW